MKCGNYFIYTNKKDKPAGRGDSRHCLCWPKTQTPHALWGSSSFPCHSSPGWPPSPEPERVSALPQGRVPVVVPERAGGAAEQLWATVALAD